MPFSTAPVCAGVYTVTSADATATFSLIPTGLLNGGANTFVEVRIIRAGVQVIAAVPVITWPASPAGTLKVAAGTGYTVTAADLIHWLVA